MSTADKDSPFTEAKQSPTEKSHSGNNAKQISKPDNDKQTNKKSNVTLRKIQNDTDNKESPKKETKKQGVDSTQQGNYKEYYRR